MKRALSPLTNGVGYAALAGLLLAVAQAVYNAHNSGQPVTWQVIATAAVGVLAGWARGKVTPVADPRDGNGQPLLTHNQHAAEHLSQILKAPLLPAEQATWTATPQPPAAPPAATEPAP